MSVIRKHPIVDTPNGRINNSGFGVGKVFWFRKQMERNDVGDVRLNLDIGSAASRQED